MKPFHMKQFYLPYVARAPQKSHFFFFPKVAYRCAFIYVDKLSLEFSFIVPWKATFNLAKVSIVVIIAFLRKRLLELLVKLAIINHHILNCSLRRGAQFHGGQGDFLRGMIKTISFLSFNITTADSDELKWFQLVLARKSQKIPKQDIPKKKIVYTDFKHNSKLRGL